MATQSTIYALSSAPGRAGVAVIRLSGPGVRSVLSHMAHPAISDRQAAFRKIVHPESGALLDRAVVLFFAGPRSETGEDVAEFQVHGGRAVVSAVLAALSTLPGCRLAEPGEFARRAFENGKLDLAEVEGLADLVDAETEAQRRQALAQASGATSVLYEDWRRQLLEAMALAEAAIDFGDEGDVSDQASALSRSKARPLADAIKRHLDDGRRGEIMRTGFRVALLGAPNAGKSSLLNALARREAAIVSEEAGTTRDVIEVRLDLGGYPVIVSDTAGLRDAGGAVEREGIRRSLKAADDAQLVLWLTETGADSPPESVSRETVVKSLWLIRTKMDLADPSERLAFAASPAQHTSPSPLRGSSNFSPPACGKGSGVGGIPMIAVTESRPSGHRHQGEGEVCDTPHEQPNSALTPTLCPRGEGAFAISAKTGEGMDALIRAIAAEAAARLGAQLGVSDAPVITQARHRQNLEAAAQSLADFLTGDTSDAELRAEDLRRAAHALGRITGRVDADEVLGEIFGRFCIGK